jgi:hypothetical protein
MLRRCYNITLGQTLWSSVSSPELYLPGICYLVSFKRGLVSLQLLYMKCIYMISTSTSTRYRTLSLQTVTFRKNYCPAVTFLDTHGKWGRIHWDTVIYIYTFFFLIHNNVTVYITYKVCCNFICHLYDKDLKICI